MATAPDNTQRTGRINLRVSPEIDNLLREAAALRHLSLSAFLLAAACDEAQSTIDEHRRIRLSTETFNRILDELDRPAEVIEPLLDVIRRVQARAATP